MIFCKKFFIIFNEKSGGYSPVAQQAEQLAVNQRAVGSSPTGGARGGQKPAFFILRNLAREMKITIFFNIFLCLSSCVSIYSTIQDKSRNIKESFYGITVRIVDGDTIEIKAIEDFSNLILSNQIYTVRLLNIDTFEVEENERFERSVDKLYKAGIYLKRKEILKLGELALSNLKAVLSTNVIVEIKFGKDSPQFDQYGRVLGIVYLNGTNINLYQLETGYALSYFFQRKPVYEYELAEKVAKRHKRGIWKFLH